MRPARADAAERRPGARATVPRPLRGHDERNEGYAALVVPELTERRLASLETVRSTAQATQLTADEMAAWMRSVNDVRLVLGTVLGVSDDGDLQLPTDATEDDRERLAVYEYLGAVLELIVQAMAR
ncbi:MAG: DUF2017 family protein [Actinomycetes bacterium]